ncbi:MAG TPA: zf-HC2 domain-containing protein [Gemmatimonadales bacterium]|nr:zf-HC2 domain-containing protein [Gemmatimonadales bacterium]
MSNPTTINCEEALRLLATYLDGELHGAEHEHVERHLKICRSCYSRAEFERRLKAQFDELRREEIQPAFEQRVRQLISEFTSPAAGEPADE